MSSEEGAWLEFLEDVEILKNEGEIDRALDLCFDFVCGSNKDQCFYGMLIGLFEERVRLNKIQRWVNFPRLAEFLGVDRTEEFEDKVIDHATVYSGNNNFGFQYYLTRQSDFKNSAWENLLY